jgi:adenosine kinase
MGEDAAIDLTGLADEVDLVVIGAGNPAAMFNLTKQCRALQIPYANDTSQQLVSLDGDQIKELVTGAAYLFCNDYEASLIEHKTGWSDAELTSKVGIRVTTLGAGGARVDQAAHEPVLVGPVKDVTPADPTGTGDAFRAGFLSGVAWGLSLERAAQLGNLVAVHALETTGPQEYKLVPAELASRCAASYGQEAADDIAAHFS